MNGELYVGLENDGLYAINMESLEMSLILADRSVSDIMVDKNGGIWATTLDNGVFYFPFKHISYLATDKSVLSIGEFHGDLYVGFRSGAVQLYDIDNNLVSLDKNIYSRKYSLHTSRF